MEVPQAYSTPHENSEFRRPSPRDPRIRAVIYGAIECARALVAGLGPGPVRGRQAAGWLLDALGEAWRQGADLDAPRSAEELRARLLAGGYLEHRVCDRAWREALRLVVRVCPLLVSRVDWDHYAIPTGELKSWGSRCQRLAGWVDRVRAVRYERTPEGARRASPNCGDLPANSGKRTDVSDSHSEDHARTLRSPRGCVPGGGRRPSPREELKEALSLREDVERARRALERWGPAIEGLGGDRRTYVALCILGDYDLEPSVEEELAAEYNRRCTPPWSPAALRRKIRSAARNRRSPRGSKILKPDPRRGLHAPSETRSPDGSDPPRSERSGAHAADVHGRGEGGERPRSEVALEVWRLARTVDADPEVTAWLHARGLDPAVVAGLDLARALVEDGPPELRWRGTWGTWRSSGHRLVLPAVDSMGVLATVRGRYVGPGEVAAKEVSPRGSASARAMLATASAVAWLKGQTRPECVWVVEGGPDFLTLASRLPPETPILGLWAGAWDPAIWTRCALQPGLHLAIATHADSGGDLIAGEVLRTVPPWVVVGRVEASEPGLDLADLALAGALDPEHLHVYDPRRRAHE